MKVPTKVALVFLQVFVYVYYQLFANYFIIAAIVQFIKFITTDESAAVVKVLLSAISLIELACQEVLLHCYNVSFEEHSFRRPHLIGIAKILDTFAAFQLAFFVMAFACGSVVIVLQFCIMFFTVIIFAQINYYQLFCQTRLSIWIHCAICFILLQLAFNTLMRIQCQFYNFSFSSSRPTTVSLIVNTIVCVYLSYYQYTRVEQPVQHSLVIRFTVMRYIHKILHCFTRKEADIHYDIPVELAVQLTCYYGPEFRGVLNGPVAVPESSQDESKDERKKREKDCREQCDQIATHIKHGEEMLENLKLLYENIYANIYLTHAACGQTLEHITLLDIEEAFPVPLLLRCAKLWKNPQNATATILHMLNSIRNIQTMLEGDSRGQAEGSSARCTEAP